MLRKIIFTLLCLGLLLFPITAFSETGTVTGSMLYSVPDQNIFCYKFHWTSTAGGAAGSDTYTESSNYINGFILQVITDPGATAPTDDYDITLVDATGRDVMDGQLADRDTSTTETAVPLVDTIDELYGKTFAFGALTLAVTNAGNAKVGDVYIIFERKR